MSDGNPVETLRARKARAPRRAGLANRTRSCAHVHDHTSQPVLRAAMSRPQTRPPTGMPRGPRDLDRARLDVQPHVEEQRIPSDRLHPSGRKNEATARRDRRQDSYNDLRARCCGASGRVQRPALRRFAWKMRAVDGSSTASTTATVTVGRKVRARHGGAGRERERSGASAAASRPTARTRRAVQRAGPVRPA